MMEILPELIYKCNTTLIRIPVEFLKIDIDKLISKIYIKIWRT